MTRRVTRKMFKNGGSWALRIPAGWLPEDAEFEVLVRDDGVLEVRPLDRERQFKEFLRHLEERGEIPDIEFPIPERPIEPERLDWDELLGKK